MIDKILDNVQKQFDERLHGKKTPSRDSLSRNIPWKEFSELEIQGILKMHFESLGFKVVWRHRDDPANENGIDLECTHKKDQNKVIVAVKKKPNKNDLGQVLQLSQQVANRRIYLYLNGAAQSFRDQMVTFESEVEFCDEKALENILDESGIAIWLKIDNSDAILALNSISKNLFASIEKSPLVSFPKRNKQTMKTLWDLKDRSVTLSKCATLAQFTFENPKRIGKLNYKQIQDLQIWYLNFLYSHSLISLSYIFESLSTDMRIIFSHTFEKTNGRSNWMMLESIHPGLVPGNVESHISHEISEKLEKLESSKTENIVKERSESDFEEYYFSQAANEFRHIGIWADGLEYTIDYLFETYLSERF